jgi:Skp family chaperone for outer membrane proteins
MSAVKQHIIIFILLCFIPISYSQASESRVALVIGNSAYTNSPLKNPSNDARDMSAKLRSQGFEVVEYSNFKTRQVGGILREFHSKLSPGSVALVFYAGHGMQIKGENYFPAVDADINAEEDVSNQSLSIKQIMDVLEDSKTRLNLVFLDACRNNPYSRGFRSAENGLARVTAPTGTLISYATRPGSVAADGDGRNGLYTSKLLKQLDSRQPIELSLKAVVSEVKAVSQGRQEPWMEGSIEGEFCFAGCGALALPIPQDPVSPALDPARMELSFWDSIKDSDDPADFEEYVKQYPAGLYAGLAHNKIRQFKAVVAKPEPAPPPVVEPPVTVRPEKETGTTQDSIYEQTDYQESGGSRIAFINVPLLEKAKAQFSKDELVKSVNSLRQTNLMILLDGVVYADDKVDITRNIIADGFKVSSNTLRQLKEIPKNLKVGFYNQFAVRNDFTARRKEELAKLQSLMVEVIDDIAKDQVFDVILTDGVIYASDQVDITTQVKQKLLTMP